jgi:hypothetical protein
VASAADPYGLNLGFLDADKKLPASSEQELEAEDDVETITTANLIMYCFGECGAEYRRYMPLVFAGRGSNDACLSAAVGHTSARPPPWEAEPSVAARPLPEGLALLLKPPCTRSLKKPILWRYVITANYMRHFKSTLGPKHPL